MRIVLCVPGNNFSGKVYDCHMQMLSYFFSSGIECLISRQESSNVYMVRNKCLGADVKRGILQKPFNGELPYDFQLWIDSDQTFNPQQIQRLINHNVDIVAGYSTYGDGTNNIACGKWDIEYFKQNGVMPCHTLESIVSEPRDEKGLVEVDYTGFAFVLIKYGVIESMQYPWFEPHYTSIAEADSPVMIYDFSGEDVGWCIKAREQGYKILVDPAIRVGHEKKLVL